MLDHDDACPARNRFVRIGRVGEVRLRASPDRDHDLAHPARCDFAGQTADLADHLMIRPHCGKHRPPLTHVNARQTRARESSGGLAAAPTGRGGCRLHSGGKRLRGGRMRVKSSWATTALAAVAAATVCSVPAGASTMTTFRLAGNVAPWTQAATPISRPARGTVAVSVYLRLRNEASLRRFVERVNDPASSQDR